jgi:ATP-dependent helicase HepA
VDAALIKDTQAYRADLKARIERGRDRLLELNSFRPAVAAQVVEAIAATDEDPALEHYLLRLFDYFGVHAEPLGGRDYLLLPGHMFDRAFPLREEQLRITYDRKQALHREDITFMSWDHPMLAGGMELLLGSEKGNSAFATAEGFKGLALHCVFVLEAIAPAALELSRFLPPTPLVLTVDEKLRELPERPGRLKDGPAWQLAGASPEQQLTAARHADGSPPAGRSPRARHRRTGPDRDAPRAGR